MTSFEKIKSYCATVCNQIKFKRAHESITQEIENHLFDQRNAYIAQGENEENATDHAIKQMGDAVFVGCELNKTHRPQPQFTLLSLVLLLISIGLFCNINLYINDNFLNLSFIASYVAAIIILFVCYFLNISLLRKYALQISLIAFALYFAFQIFSLSSNMQNFIKIGSISVSLSAYSIMMPFVFALFIYSMRSKGVKGLVLSCMYCFAISIAILFSTSNFIYVILFLIVSLVLMLFCVQKKWFNIPKKQGIIIVLIPFLIISIVFLLYIFSNDYAIGRISEMLGYKENSYFLNYTKKLMEDSKFIGSGISYIPVNSYLVFNPDFMFTRLITSFGFYTFLIILSLIAVFIGFSIRSIVKHKSFLGKLISISILLVFIFQFVIYTMNNVGIISTNILSLPFVSVGGTTLGINAALIGIMLSVFRTGRVLTDIPKKQRKIA